MNEHLITEEELMERLTAEQWEALAKGSLASALSMRSDLENEGEYLTIDVINTVAEIARERVAQ